MQVLVATLLLLVHAQSLQATTDVCQTSTAQRVELQAYNLPAYYIGLTGQEAYIKSETRPDQWILVPSVCGIPGTVSFKSAHQHGYYLQHRNYLMYSDFFHESESNKQNFCYTRHKNLFFDGSDVFESVNNRGWFVAHSNYRVRIERQQSNVDFELRASFRVVEPICQTILSYNFRDRALGLNGNDVHLKKHTPDKWVLVKPGLTGHKGSVSFRMCNDARKYLYHGNFVVSVRSATTHNWLDAVFTIRENKWYNSYDAYESVNFPGYFLRHQHFRLNIHSYSGDTLFKKDASYKIQQYN